MFDLQRFLNRMRWTQDDLSKAIGISKSKAAAWSAGYRKPLYEDIVTLLKAGMTISEIFDDEIEGLVLKNQPSLDLDNLSQDDCRRIVQVAFGSILQEPKDRPTR